MANYCKRVIAFEIDENLVQKLKQQFKDHSEKIELRLGNFLEYSLPSYQCKVFANIPFNITSDIIKKLIFSKNPPLDSYLIVQEEAARKFAGKPLSGKNSLMSILIKTQFEVEIFHRFKRSDFFPKPRVETVMLKIKRLEKPLLSKEKVGLFYDFVTYAYSQFEPNILRGLSGIIDKQTIRQLAKDEKFRISSKPGQLEIGHWTALFETFLQHSNKAQKNEAKGSFKKLQMQQSRLQKIHRTRLDKDWRQYKTD